MIEQMLFTLFCTVFFCLGLHLTSQDGYKLDFLQKPYNWAEIVIQDYENPCRSFGSTWKYCLAIVVTQFWTPLIMCITCMGSIWGVTWFILLNGFSLHVLPYMVINCFASAFIQTFIWKLYAKINI